MMLARHQLRLERLELRELLTTDVVEVCSVEDVFDAIRRGDVAYDLNEDGQIDLADADFLVEEVFNTRWGDLNLDGTVEFNDYLNLSAILD